jgi:hypothetical protein
MELRGGGRVRVTQFIDLDIDREFKFCGLRGLENPNFNFPQKA